MTPEDLVKTLQENPRIGLQSVVLYGSAAAGDHAGKRSDYNVLVVTERLGLPELKAFAATAEKWAKAGNPPPLLFTLDRLKKSADVFPIELLDIKETHRILFGEHILDDLDVSEENLRLEIEHELKGKLIQLRERYLLTRGKPRRVLDLMIDSLSTFLVLFRAALRLYQQDIPQKKMDALKALSEHIGFQSDVFASIQELKAGTGNAKNADTDQLFERYLSTIEAVVDSVDAHIRKQDKGEQQ